MSQTSQKKPDLGAHCRGHQPGPARSCSTGCWRDPRSAPSWRRSSIGIFFLIVAPPFRSADSLATVLYQSATIGIVAVGRGDADDRRRVRPLRRRHGDGGRTGQRDLLLRVRHQPVGRRGALPAFALIIGFLNGYLVMKTGIASFLITLGTFFVLQGVNLGVTKLVTGSVTTRNINQMDGYDQLNAIFALDVHRSAARRISIIVLWWFLFVAVSTWVLHADQDRQLDLRRRRQRGQRPRRRRTRAQGQGRPVHDGLVPGLVHGHAHPLPVQHAAVRQRRRQRVPLHHRRGRRWHAAHGRLRQRHRRGHRRRSSSA